MPDGFFDIREKLLPPRRGLGAASATASATAAGGLKPLSVTELTRLVDAALKAKLPPQVLVRGEVSNFSYHRGSGHAYFTLKDAGACINCVMFRGEFARVPFQVDDGMELLAGGNVRVYAQQGRHQLYVDHLQPLGRGALELALQQRRAKLEAEGLFHPDRKKPLPRYPSCIALVTSRETAALADMLKVLRRVAGLRLMLYHVPVQGDGCGSAIADAIAHLNRRHRDVGGIDLILLGRGGGSLEDLWGFNDEALVRAIAASRLPIITGIGHEVDVSLADLAADHWAHTPTEAATHAIAHWRTAPALLDSAAAHLARSIRSLLSDLKQQLAAIERHEFFRRPTSTVDRLRMLLDDRERSLLLGAHQTLRRGRDRLDRSAAELASQHPRHSLRLHAARIEAAAARLRRDADQVHKAQAARVDLLSARLQALSPLAVLNRGYSITTLKKGGQIIRSSADAKPGQTIVTRLPDGTVESIVEDAAQPKLFD